MRRPVTRRDKKEIKIREIDGGVSLLNYFVGVFVEIFYCVKEGKLKRIKLYLG